MDKTALSSFIAYCNKNFDDIAHFHRPPQFNSLSICVIDCVYSLRAKYNSTTIRVVKKYADKYMNGDIYSGGDPNRCKPDIHIHQCIKDACGYNVSNEECQELFREAVAEMNDMYPDLTVRDLDYIVWNKYQGGRW